MTITRCMMLLVCGAALALGACSDTKTVPTGDAAAVEKAQREAAAAKASLKELRDSLTAAQSALGASTVTEQREALAHAMEDLETARTRLGALDDGAGKSEATEALAKLGDALKAIDEALRTAASGASGPVALANRHTMLTAAQAAIDAAQTALKTALTAAPAANTALRDLLAQAQASLITAQCLAGAEAAQRAGASRERRG